MVGVEYTCLIASYALSCWINYGLHQVLPSIESWRGAFYVQMVLATVLLLMSFVLPETPRWLAGKGLYDDCLKTIADLHPAGNVNDTEVNHVFLEIKEAIKFEKSLGKPSWKVRSPFFVHIQ